MPIVVDTSPKLTIEMYELRVYNILQRQNYLPGLPSAKELYDLNILACPYPEMWNNVFFAIHNGHRVDIHLSWYQDQFSTLKVNAQVFLTAHYSNPIFVTIERLLGQTRIPWRARKGEEVIAEHLADHFPSAQKQDQSA